MKPIESAEVPHLWTKCLRCDGSGFLPCGGCGGSGASIAPGRPRRALDDCPDCYSGEIRCTLCTGSGRLALIVLCAWRAAPDCPYYLRGPRLAELPDDYPISHGVCESCARLEMAA